VRSKVQGSVPDSSSRSDRAMEPWFWFSSPDEPLWFESECERDREGHRSEDSVDSLDGIIRGEKREGEGEEEGTLEGRDRDGEGRKGEPREGEREAD
jgi:hypothetical protein